MSKKLFSNPAVWAFVGLVAGVLLMNSRPEQQPIFAAGATETENFAICTGPIDGDGEAVYMLDFLTGDLRGAVLNPNNGKFTTVYSYNVVKDLGVDVTKKPQYAMVAGSQVFRRGAGGVQFGDNVVYVAELTSGKVAAYGMPWNRAARSNVALSSNSFVPLDITPFRNVVIRDQ